MPTLSQADTSWKQIAKYARKGKSQDARVLAKMFTRQSIATLAHLMYRADDQRLRAECAKALLDRGHGKPAQSISIFAGDAEAPKVIDAVAELFGLEDAAAPVMSEPSEEIVAPSVRSVRFSAGRWIVC